MPLRIDERFPIGGLQLLRQCYAFVNNDWQHCARLVIPDQGFEIRFRESCITRLAGWVVSQERELRLGCGLDTASGVNHEVDLVVQWENLLGILELKNRQGFPPEKNDVIVFFAKMLDYFALTPSLLNREVVPVFMSCFPFEPTGLAACLGLGIHPIAPQLRPLPLLIDNARRIQHELDSGTELTVEDANSYDDFCAMLNRLTVTLAPAALNHRCDCLNEQTITVSAVGPFATGALSDELLAANRECERLVEAVIVAKTGSRP